MTQRLAKVASLIRQTVAGCLPELLEANSAAVTVTAVDVSPDLRQATVWVSVLDVAQQKTVLEAIEGIRADVQRRVASAMTTKFVPKLSFKLDSGGEYADRIARLLHTLD